jgi:mannose-6-phosphate isomerase-like protein (cupin superfamily)
MEQHAISGYAVKTIDDMEARHHGAVKLAGAELGIQSFGMQVLEFPAGFDDYPEHDHAEDGQEEVYVVLRGGGVFEIDGEPVAIEAGQMVRVDPPRRRKLRPGSEGVAVLAIGAPADRAYERPEGFRLEARS